MPDSGQAELKLTGIAAAPGICIGKAYLVDREGVDVIKKYDISEGKLPDEVRRFKSAVNRAVDELRSIIEDIPKDFLQHAAVLETHMAMLKDKMLYNRIIETIEKERVNSEWAVKKVVSSVRSQFRKMADSYLKERAADIEHVADRIMRNLVGADTVDIAAIDKRVILVAHDLSPAETSQIQLERIKGFITDRGGVASHTGIIARTLEIPAVLGLDNATGIIKNDDLIVVDGSAGVVILNPSEETLLDYEERRGRFETHKAFVARSSHLSAETLDGVAVRVMGNIELPEEVVSVKSYGGDGIGLYRTEFQYLSRAGFPDEDELFEVYKDVAEIMAPEPVTIRTLDINGDKAVGHGDDYEEINPALGLRAIRYCLKKPAVFRTQLRAILRAAAFGNIRILLPMISGIDEIRATKKLLSKAADALKQQGIAHNRDLEIGIMIEVPSAALMADVLACETDFFSIGTNDLTQYTLAIDRANRHVAHLFSPLHPAVLRLLKQVSDTARAKGVKLFMCGEMAGDPVNTPILLGLGLDELSMNPQSIPAVKSIIRSLNAEDCKRFAAEIFKQTTTKDVLDLIDQSFGTLLSEKLEVEQ